MGTTTSITAPETPYAHRLSTIQVKEDCHAEVVVLLKQLDMLSFGFVGLKYLVAIKTSPTELVIQAIYDTEENAAKSSAGDSPTVVEKAFGSMKQFMTAPPKRTAGQTVHEAVYHGDLRPGAVTVKQVQLQPGKLGDMIAHLASPEVQEQVQVLPGGVAMSMIQLADNELLSIVHYDTMENLKYAQGQLVPIMAVMKDELDLSNGPPKGQQGTVIHIWTPETNGGGN